MTYLYQGLKKTTLTLGIVAPFCKIDYSSSPIDGLGAKGYDTQK